MRAETVIYTAAAVTLLGLIAYVIFGGADFGGGVWDLLATGPRKQRQREAITLAMGPVWEANHVWLIFVLVMLFTCWPRGFAGLAVTLFLPFHMALFGIMLRGASFVFRAYAKPGTNHPTGMAWGVVFGIASLISPFLLGAAFGAVTAGHLFVEAGGKVSVSEIVPWLRPYSIVTGLLAVSACAYLAAVYLAVEVAEDLKEDFRLRAILSGTTTAVLAAATLYLAWREAHWFFSRITSPAAWPVLAVGLVFFAGSAFAVFTRRYPLARVCAAAEIVCLLLGWGVAQAPYLAYPSYTLIDSAAPLTTIRFVLFCLPVGAAMLAPGLWLVFWVFKMKPETRMTKSE
jgi:cytochrome d ubiquinol oxidase subunit II